MPEAGWPPGYVPEPGGGKAAGVPCPHLTEDLRCGLWGSPLRPAVCASLTPTLEMCGTCAQEALQYLNALERSTRPES